MTKPKPLPKVKYSIICDDIREEKGNKYTLVGVYTEDIYPSKVPALVPKLCFRICIDTSLEYIREFNLLIKRPNNTTIGPFLAKIVKEGKTEAYLNITISPFIFEEIGEYELIIEEGKREKRIHRFSVKAGDPSINK